MTDATTGAPTLTVRNTRDLKLGQSCRVRVVDVATGEIRTVHESRDILLEAPNWTAEGTLVLNGDGALWSLAPDRGEARSRIPITGLPDLNNDHVLAPDGETIYLSANDWHIYRAPLVGGVAERITVREDRMHFLHGVSPDGASLAYIGIDDRTEGAWGPGRIFTIGVDGTGARQLVGGDAPSDGCEWAPDGAWIYFNTEIFSQKPGHAQIARIRPDGDDVQQLTFDERVNWFPHVSPDGQRVVYLSYPAGTIGHPADLPVQLRVVAEGDWTAPIVVADLLGGQGSINVNSWSPDSGRFAFVDYPQEVRTTTQ